MADSNYTNVADPNFKATYRSSAGADAPCRSLKRLIGISMLYTQESSLIAIQNLIHTTIHKTAINHIKIRTNYLLPHNGQ